MNDSLTPGQRAVLRSFHEFGPMTDVALTVYAHHVVDDGQSSSSLRSRRAELVAKKLLKVVGTKTTSSGRSARVHALTPRGAKRAAKLFATVTP